MITAEKNQAMLTAFNASLQKGISTSARPIPGYAAVISSSAASEKYPVSVVAGMMREWSGSFVIETQKFEELEVLNQDYKAAVRVNRNDIEDNRLNGYALQFENMGVQSEDLWAALAGKVLMNPGKWADGSTFFSESRKIGKSVIDNTITGLLTVDNFLAARAKMMAYKMPDGITPMAIVPDTLIVGPLNEMAAKRLLEAQFTYDSTDKVQVDNLCRGMAKIIVDLGITDERWFLACTSRPVKPLIIQQRKKGTLVAEDREDSRCVLDSNVNEYHIHSRGNAALTVPHFIIKGQ